MKLPSNVHPNVSPSQPHLHLRSHKCKILTTSSKYLKGIHIIDKFVDIISSRYYLHMDIEALWDILSDPIHFRIVTFKNVDSK